MAKKRSHLGWLAAGLAASGLAMTPAISRVLSNSDGVQNAVSLKSLGSIGSFTVAGADPKLAAQFEVKALRGNTKFKFTPAGGTNDRERSMTVVVRQNALSNKAISIRENVASVMPGSGMSIATKITPVSYSLGSAKGLKSFAIPVRKLAENLPDLSEIGAGLSGDDKDSGKKSRFNTRVKLDAKSPVDAAPRALTSSQKDISFDLGGSYSVTRNLEVTAGVRLKNERDRMAPLTDSRQDSQAVYVGTQFRF